MAKKRPPPVAHLHYHKDGTLWARGQMRAGVMVGYWEFFRKDGTRLRSGHFDDVGQQVGDWTTYDKAGQVYKVSQLGPRKPPAKTKKPRKA